ncbi:tetratricopeptide repeat protein [Fulvivirga sp. 1062]|uniref:Tetratricopeptide repeat protein n=2 Tax=Fulvivirga sedimenti TaxID=2879465 RepID=A0A9X1HP72_9BACT|nr:tetratricopeptide repeat protein [Fulvivirga sedimenti]MCA6075797.1 tetratricopeptide repeat protein [Fulvivirga sedimenti]MCA6076925.1 tetratricopeptide repeat protein [Fulvivirga sedimenti]
MRQFVFIFLTWALCLTGCSNDQSEIGDRMFRKGNYEQAIAAYTEYLRLNPSDIKTIYNRGRAYQELGKNEKALEDFQRVIKEDPLNVNALLSVSNDYFNRLRDYENAIFYADKVLKANPNAIAFTVKGKSYQKMGKLTEAMAAYNDALSTNDSYADAYLSRGSLFIYLNQYNKACSDFQRAKALDQEVSQYIEKYCK